MIKLKSISIDKDMLSVNYFNGTYTISLNGILKTYNQEYRIIDILFDRYTKDILQCKEEKY